MKNTLGEKRIKHTRGSKHRKLGIVGRLLVFFPVLIALIAAAAASEYSFASAVLGDVNGDGVVSDADSAYILGICSRSISDYSAGTAVRADLNGDGLVSAEDARIAKSNVTRFVTILESANEAPTQPLVDSSSLMTKDDSGNKTAVVSSGSVSVISNEKMYLYPDLSQVMSMRDSFIIISFGWGHGVGMSQRGAIGLARAGYSYTQIIQHYYTGVSIIQESYPATVRCAGRDVDTVEMLARIIQQEISGCTVRDDPLDMNALRAQAVAAYSNMKFSGYSVSGCSYVSSYERCRDDVKRAAAEIAGQYIEYGGQVVYAYYSACSAGVTATYSEVWGPTSRDMSYLSNTASYYDCSVSDYLSATAYPVETIKNYILAYDPSITLSDNPADWLEILEHDDSVNENIGYVSRMRVGDRIINSSAGMTFRDKIMRYNVKSPCFAVIYNGEYI